MTTKELKKKGKAAEAGALLAAAASGADLRYVGGRPVSFVHCSVASAASLRRALRRRLPIVAIVDKDTSDETAWSLRGSWSAAPEADPLSTVDVERLNRPLIALLLEGADAGALAPAGEGPDIVIAVRGDGDGGDVDLAVADVAGAEAAIAEALVVLQSVTHGRGTVVPPAPGSLTDVVPFELDGAYDMTDVVARLVDGGRTVPIARPHAAGVSTALASIGGIPVGIMASRPERDQGRLDSAEIRRIERFVRLTGALRLPLVSLVDTAGERWSDSADLLGALRDALLAVQSPATPKCVVITGRAYGLGAALMGAVAARADYVVAWARADLAGRAYTEDDELGPLATSPFAAVEAAVIHEVLEPDATRQALIDVLGSLTTVGADEGSDGH